MPRRLETDPDSLLRAVDELHEARELWRAGAEEYAAQRRAQKRSGRRTRPVPPWWDRYRWGPLEAAWHHDPFLHPPLSLPDYVRRRNALLDGAELPGCPACGEEGPAVPVPTGHGEAGLCRSCARVLTPCPCGRWHGFEPSVRYGWSRTWRREHMTDSGEPDPRWPGVRGAAGTVRPAAQHPRAPAVLSQARWAGTASRTAPLPWTRTSKWSMSPGWRAVPPVVRSTPPLPP